MSIQNIKLRKKIKNSEGLISWKFEINPETNFSFVVGVED